MINNYKEHKVQENGINSQKVNRIIVQNKCQKWSPYSSLAARYFYEALDTGLTKIKVEDLLEV
jgi:hypothetical protein